jgi:hypothetical protein
MILKPVLRFRYVHPRSRVLAFSIPDYGSRILDPTTTTKAEEEIFFSFFFSSHKFHTKNLKLFYFCTGSEKKFEPVYKE